MMTREQHRAIDYLRTLGYTVQVGRGLPGGMRRVTVTRKMGRGVILLNIMPGGQYMPAGLAHNPYGKEYQAA